MVADISLTFDCFAFLFEFRTLFFQFSLNKLFCRTWCGIDYLAQLRLFIVLRDFISRLAMSFPWFAVLFDEYYVGAITSLWLDRVLISFESRNSICCTIFGFSGGFSVCCDHLVKFRLFVHSSSSFENHYILLFLKTF